MVENSKQNNRYSGAKKLYGINGAVALNKKWKGDENIIIGDILYMYGNHVQIYAGNNRWYNAGKVEYLKDSKKNINNQAPYLDTGTKNPGKNPWTWTHGIRLDHTSDPRLTYEQMIELFLEYNKEAWEEIEFTIATHRWIWRQRSSCVIYVNFIRTIKSNY